MTDKHPELAALLAERTTTMASFVEGYKPECIYAICRRDLAMSPSKMAAQCGHAFSEVVEHYMQTDPSAISTYKGTGHGTKIIMSVKNEGQLMRVYDEVKALGLPCFMVVDRGHVIPDSMFTGAPILTAVGFGIATREQVASVTKKCTMV